MNLRKRPLSPHLQIYRVQLTTLLSIMHRFTGIFLFLSGGVWVLFLSALAAGPGYYEEIEFLLRSPFGVLFGIGWVFSLSYHLLNGIRHLFWDLGKGFELKMVYTTGWGVVIGSLMLTTLTLMLIF